MIKKNGVLFDELSPVLQKQVVSALITSDYWDEIYNDVHVRSECTIEQHYSFDDGSVYLREQGARFLSDGTLVFPEWMCGAWSW